MDIDDISGSVDCESVGWNLFTFSKGVNNVAWSGGLGAVGQFASWEEGPSWWVLNGKTDWDFYNWSIHKWDEFSAERLTEGIEIADNSSSSSGFVLIEDIFSSIKGGWIVDINVELIALLDIWPEATNL